MWLPVDFGAPGNDRKKQGIRFSAIPSADR
jgi:hypothetical protein